MSEGKVEAAEQELKAALSVDPQYLEAKVDLGVLYAKEGKKSEAKRLFRQAIEINPKSAAAFANLGLLFASEGNDREAEQQLVKADNTSPDDAIILRALASLQSKLGSFVKSACTFERLVKLQPRSAQAHLDFGMAMTALYRHDEALEEFSEAIRLSPDLAAAHLYSGRTLYDLGRIGEAKTELQVACRLATADATCRYLLALVERRSKNIALSVKHLEEAAKLEPQNADIRFLLGKSWFEIGETDKAVVHWKAALEASPEHWQSLNSLVQVLSASRSTEARKYQDILRALQSGHRVLQKVDFLRRLAQQAAAAREWAGAFGHIQQAMQECGDCTSEAQLHRALGMLYYQTGKLSDGERELLIASQLSPVDTGGEDVARQIEAASRDRSGLCHHVSAVTSEN
jgi:tetratricopeptide (TPR) repeat protein